MSEILTREFNAGDDDLLALINDDKVEDNSDSDISDDDLLSLLDETTPQHSTNPAELEESNISLSDLLDNTYTVSESNMDTIEFKVDFEDNAVMALDMTESADDFIPQFAFDEDLEEDSKEDSELIQVLRESLQKRGYVHTNLYDYEQLLELATDETHMLDKDYEKQQIALYVENFNTIRNLIKENKATYVANNANNLRSNNIQITNNLDLDADFIENVNEEIIRALDSIDDINSAKSELTPNIIYNRLYTSLPAEMKVHIENPDLYTYLQSAIPIFIEARQNDYYVYRDEEMRRSKTTNFLLHRENKSVNIMLNSECSTIKQIFRQGNNYKYYCPNCHKMVEMSSNIVSYIVFASERDSYFPYMMPNVIKCSECSGNLLLSADTYDRVNSNVNKGYKDGISKLFNFLSKISTGTAITKINPDFDIMFDGLNIIADLALDDDSKVLEIIDTKENIKYPEGEYVKALKMFYNKLHTFGTAKVIAPMETSDIGELEDNSGSFDFSSTDNATQCTSNISTKELAVCIATELSLNYQELKNKAIFSLIMTIDEFECLREVLNRQEFWDNEIALKFLSQIDSVCDNSKELNATGIALIKYQGDPKDISSLKNAFIQYRDNVIKQNAEIQKNYTSLLEQIEKSTDLLSFTKILNIRQIDARLLTFYLCDDYLMEIFDDITDKMIINNYAERYSNVFFRISAFNKKATFKRTLEKVASGNPIVASLNKILEDEFGYSLSKDMLKALSYTSANHLICLRDAAENLKRYSYYRFIEELNNLSDCSTLINPAYDAKLKGLKTLVKSESDILKKGYYEYYLADFSSEEIALLDSSERILMYSIEFERFVPKRLEDESLSDYLKRYEILYESDLFYTVECYDYKEYFEKFKEYFILIIAGYNVLNLEDNNFIVGNVMRSLLYLVYSEFPRSFGLMFLGYSEEYFNRIMYSGVYALKSDIFKQNDALYHVLYGQYVSAGSIFITPYRMQYEQLIVDELFDISKMQIPKVQDIMQVANNLDDTAIIELERTNQLSRKTEKLEGSPDDAMDDVNALREDIINELELYLEG